MLKKGKDMPEKKKEKPVQMTVQCPFCKKTAGVFKYKAKKTDGLYIFCKHCSSRAFGSIGIYKYLSDNYPMRTKLIEMTYSEFNQYRKRAE
jgi:hypothetical protein